MKPYISLDLETTGVNIERSKILQIGLVYDDGKTQIDKLPKRNIFVKWDTIEYAEPYAINMNSWIFEKICKNTFEKDEHVLSIDDAIEYTLDFIRKYSRGTMLQIAGKNVAQFDIPILLNHMNSQQKKNFREMIQRRTIDVGSAYLTYFKFNPSLDQINRKIGYNMVSHDALDDASNVVFALRWLFK